MKLWIVFRKTLLEMRRDLWVLGLTLAFAPCFVFLYWLWFSGGSTTYTVLVINHDRGAASPDGMIHAGEQVAKAIEGVIYADGKPLLKVTQAQSRQAAESILRDRGAVAFIEIPEDFSRALLDLQGGGHRTAPRIIFGGDLTNPYYMVGANLALTAVDEYVRQVSGQPPLVQYSEQAIGASGARTEFETYVPGVIILSVILLIFQAAMLVAREIETGVLKRMQLTPMTSFDFLGGITAALLLVSILSILITFGTAVGLGFRSQGPLWVAILIGAVATLSTIGIGLVVACFTRTVSQAFVVANFPLALLMFFSGAIFPLPKATLFTIAGRAIGLYDILPPTHAVVALNKILTLGAGIGDVIYELAALLVLSVLYFALGAWLFKRMHLQPV